MEKFGVVRLHQIKYKYFSDKALQLWELMLCILRAVASSRKVNSSLNEYLLVKNFNIVFEAIIDELVGDKQLPDRLNKKLRRWKNSRPLILCGIALLLPMPQESLLHW